MNETTDSLHPVEHHPLHPFIPQGAKLLMLGSFPPPRHRWSMDFFYPNFTNDMWRIMGLIFENDKDFFVDIPHKRFDQQKITDFAEHKGIALYDTATAVRRLRDNASDDFLEIVTPTDVKDMLAAMPQCTAVVTTGKKATDTLCGLFALQPPTIGGSVSFFHAGRQLTFFRMPSSSRAYPLALPKKAETYRKMFEQLSLL